MDKDISLSSSLVKDRDNRNKFACGGWSAYADVSLDNNKHEWGYLRLYCKRWDCPDCGGKRAYDLRKAIANEAVRLNLRRFMTLTLNPSKCTFDNSVQYIRDCWNKLRVYLKRLHKEPFSFIAVLELQQSGYAHLHVLISHYISQKWLSEAWDSLGGGRVVDIRMVNVEKIANYVSKYLTKDLFFSTIKTKYRRCTTSRDITLFEKKPKKYHWGIIKLPLDDLYALGSFEAYDMEKDYLCNVRFFKLPYYILRKFDNIPLSIYSRYKGVRKELT